MKLTDRTAPSNNKFIGGDNHETYGANSPIKIDKRTSTPESFWSKFGWVIVGGLFVTIAGGIVMLLITKQFFTSGV